MTKYYNRKTTVGGIEFDSAKEARRWGELQLLERAGKIQDLRRQVKYELIPAQYEPPTLDKRGRLKSGKLIERSTSYVADFVYTQDGLTIVEDTKGYRTEAYKLKRKLMLYRYGIRIREV